MSATEYYPLQFVPVLQDYVWGGTQLHALFGKGAHDGPWAESWEIVDHVKAQSVVANGPCQGWTLRQLMERWGPSLVGDDVWQTIHRPQIPSPLRGRFPLLFKFLDARWDLSVQVHPNDAQAALLDPPDRGKSEAWFVLHAQAGARMYVGTNPGVTRADFLRAVNAGTVADLLHTLEPRIGDCIYVPAGTPHAIGGGLVIAEIQQASDTTYRVFDWNRVDAAGNSRPLHVQEAIDAIDFDRGPVNPLPPPEDPHSPVVELLRVPYFRIRRWKPSTTVTLDSAGSFRILSIVAGSCDMQGDWGQLALTCGNTVLVPAAFRSVQLVPRGECQLLEFSPGNESI